MFFFLKRSELLRSSGSILPMPSYLFFKLLRKFSPRFFYIYLKNMLIPKIFYILANDHRIIRLILEKDTSIKNEIILKYK